MEQERTRLRPDENEVTATIVELVKQFPFYGYRKITAILQYQRGITINSVIPETSFTKHTGDIVYTFSNQEEFQWVGRSVTRWMRSLNLLPGT